jgi:hypothetical protein
LIGKKAKGEEKLKGERLRDLVFMVYLNNKYGKGKNKISELEEIVGYGSAGGIYHALDSSGYFERNGNEIKLTKLGNQLLKNRILAEYNLANTTGSALVIIALVLLLQWVEWTYFKNPMIIQWYAIIPLLIGGLFIRFFLLRLVYWKIKRQKKIA